MNIGDKLPINKDINYLSKREAKHPLLQIIYKDKSKSKEFNNDKNIFNNKKIKKKKSVKLIHNTEEKKKKRLYLSHKKLQVDEKNEDSHKEIMSDFSKKGQDNIEKNLNNFILRSFSKRTKIINKTSFKQSDWAKINNAYSQRNNSNFFSNIDSSNTFRENKVQCQKSIEFSLVQNKFKAKGDNTDRKNYYTYTSKKEKLENINGWGKRYKRNSVNYGNIPPLLIGNTGKLKDINHNFFDFAKNKEQKNSINISTKRKSEIFPNLYFKNLNTDNNFFQKEPTIQNYKTNIINKKRSKKLLHKYNNLKTIDVDDLPHNYKDSSNSSGSFFSSQNMDQSSKKSIMKIGYFYVNEEDYIKKKRDKMIEKSESTSRSEYFNKTYIKDIKNDYLRNNIMIFIAKKISNNLNKIDNNSEDELEDEKDKKNNFDILNSQILECAYNKCILYDEKIKIFIKHIKKPQKTKKEIKINNNYILNRFDKYESLLKQFEKKWEIKYKKMKTFQKLVEEFISKNDNKINLKEILKKDFDFEENLDDFKIAEISKNSFKKTKYNSRKRISVLKYPSKTRNSFFVPNLKLNNLGQYNEAKEDNKPQNEFGLKKRTENHERLSKLYRLSFSSNQKSSSKKITNLLTNINEENTISSNRINKHSLFKAIKHNIDNYNILKNKTIFNYKKGSQMFNLGQKFVKFLRNNKKQIKLDKKLKIDSMTIKFAGIEQLTKKASLIRTQEIEKELPEIKIFDKFVSLIQTANINNFYEFLDEEEQMFPNIINLQEFSTGNTLLIYATKNNLKDIVDLLLSKGAQPNIQNKFGNTALHEAYKNGNPFIINLLIEYGAEQKLKNYNNLLPWQISRAINI